MKPDIERMRIEVGEVIGGKPLERAYHRGTTSEHVNCERVSFSFKTPRYFHVERLEEKSRLAPKDPGQEKPGVRQRGAESECGEKKRPLDEEPCDIKSRK